MLEEKGGKVLLIFFIFVLPPGSGCYNTSTMNRLRQVLDIYYREYDFPGRLLSDPIAIPHRYSDARDIEVAGFIASSLAYGKVDLFLPVAGRILSLMGQSPYQFLIGFSVAKHRRLFSGIKYRFNQNDDIIALLFLLHEILSTHSSLERLFRQHYRKEDESIEQGLSGLMAAFLQADTTKVYGTNRKPPGLLQFFPIPEKGSACKRANLFLRWMVRDRDIDFGIWKEVPKNRLVIPLDTHIARIAACLGFTQRRTQDWKMAVEITQALKRLDADDPLKYDFALCHHGIAGLCAKGKAAGCKSCVFRAK